MEAIWAKVDQKACQECNEAKMRSHIVPHIKSSRAIVTCTPCFGRQEIKARCGISNWWFPLFRTALFSTFLDSLYNFGKTLLHLDNKFHCSNFQGDARTTCPTQSISSNIPGKSSVKAGADSPRRVGRSDGSRLLSKILDCMRRG